MTKSSVSLAEEWWGQILDSLRRLFERQDDSVLYGPHHAQAVEDLLRSRGQWTDGGSGSK